LLQILCDLMPLFRLQRFAFNLQRVSFHRKKYGFNVFRFIWRIHLLYGVSILHCQVDVLFCWSFNSVMHRLCCIQFIAWFHVLYGTHIFIDNAVHCVYSMWLFRVRLAPGHIFFIKKSLLQRFFCIHFTRNLPVAFSIILMYCSAEVRIL
jgi:hypothetical protein